MPAIHVRFSSRAEFEEGPGQLNHTNAATPAANAIIRRPPVRISRVTSHSPPPSHTARLVPAGTSSDSASAASAHSRRRPGSSLAARPSSPASNRENRSMTPPLAQRRAGRARGEEL